MFKVFVSPATAAKILKGSETFTITPSRKNLVLSYAITSDSETQKAVAELRKFSTELANLLECFASEEDYV